MRRICETVDPDRAAEVCDRIHIQKYGSAYRDNPRRRILGNAGAEMSAKSFALLAQSGMHVIEVHEDTCNKLLQLLGDEPRWHVLMQDGPTIVVQWSQHTQLLDTIDTVCFITPGSQGVRVHALISRGEMHEGTQEHIWQTLMFCSGVIDILSWRVLMRKGHMPGYPIPQKVLDQDFDLRAFVAAMLHAVAAFMEKQVLPVDEKGSKPKGKKVRRKSRGRGSRKSRSVKHMKLDLNGLSALLSGKPKKAPSKSGESNGRGPKDFDCGDRKSPRKHECEEHTRKYWVKTVLPDHTATGETRQGKHGILYAILKTIKKHDRGTGIEANIYKLHRG
jgi:hypothetical protein